MWRTVKLGDFITVQNGYAFNSKLFDADGDIGLIRIRDLKEGISTETRYTGEFDSKFVVKSGDLLIGMDGEFRCYEWKGEDALLNQRVCRLQDFNKDLDKRFLLYAINDELKKIEDVTGFTTVKHLSSKTIKEIQLLLPPLAEQQRIVAKLDAAFAEIDKVVEITNAKLESSEQLFLKELDCSVNDEVEGENKLLGEVCELAQGLAINKGTKHLLVEKSSKPLIRIKDLVNGTEEQYITDDYENQKTEVTEADLVFTRTGSLGLVFRGRRGVLHNNSFKVTPTEKVTSDYLYWWLKNPSFLSEIHRIAGKAAQPDISHKFFKAQVIKIPSHSKQLQVVTKIESIYEETQKLMDILTTKLFHLANLKSGILAQELQPSRSEAV